MKKQKGFFSTSIIFFSLLILLGLLGGFMNGLSPSPDEAESIGLLGVILNKEALLIFLAMAIVESACLYIVFSAEKNENQ